MTTFTRNLIVNRNMPEPYKQHALMILREDMGLELYNILWKNKNPVVIEINEREPIQIDYDNDELRIDVRLTEVQYRDVVMQRERYESMTSISQMNFWQRLQFLFGIRD